MAYKNKADRNAYARRYNKEHKEQVRAVAKKSYYKHLKKNRERSLWNVRRYNYGITKAQYKGLLIKQQNCCAICGTEFVESPHIDHNHETGEVRGLLCHNCNILIGNAREDFLILARAASYLMRFL